MLSSKPPVRFHGQGHMGGSERAKARSRASVFLQVPRIEPSILSRNLILANVSC